MGPWDAIVQEKVPFTFFAIREAVTTILYRKGNERRWWTKQEQDSTGIDFGGQGWMVEGMRLLFAIASLLVVVVLFVCTVDGWWSSSMPWVPPLSSVWIQIKLLCYSMWYTKARRLCCLPLCVLLHISLICTRSSSSGRCAMPRWLQRIRVSVYQARRAVDGSVEEWMGGHKKQKPSNATFSSSLRPPPLARLTVSEEAGSCRQNHFGYSHNGNS